jgi:hypothetical protein
VFLPRGETSDKTYRASGSLHHYQYRIVKLSAAGVVAICGAGQRCLGVLKNRAHDGDQASVVTRGECSVYVDASSAIAAGDRIKSAANGVGVKVAETKGGDAGGVEFLGIAQEGLASGTGVIIVDVQPGVYASPSIFGS